MVYFIIVNNNLQEDFYQQFKKLLFQFQKIHFQFHIVLLFHLVKIQLMNVNEWSVF